MYLEHI